MTEEARPARPSQVTLAAWAIMVGSLFVVVTAFETVSGLRSMEMRETLEDLLGTPPFNGLGLDVGGARELMRVSAMVCAGSATAAGMLGYQLLRRNRLARMLLTVLAVPIFVAGLVTSPFFSSLVVVSISMLWLHPARSWFNGTWRPDAPLPELPPVPASMPPPLPPWAGPSTGETPPGAPGPPPVGPMPGIPDAWEPTPYHLRGPRPGPPGQHRPRPNAVTWACALTWFFATVSLILSVLSVAVVVAEPALLLDELRRQNPELASGVSEEIIVRTTIVTGGVLIVWSLVAGVLATLTFQGVAGGRMALLVLMGATGGFLVVGAVLGQLVLVVPLTAVLVTYAALVRPDVRGWFRRE